MNKNICFSIIVPVYNEAEVVRETYRRLTNVMEDVGEPYELIFVNDGSRDLTAELLYGVAEEDERVRLLDFSRNFGHQIAITAGLDYARGQAMIIIDGDLQDPPELIPQMIERWKAGYEVVYARRTQRLGESWFKKTTASVYYRLLKGMSEIDIPLDTGDYRLMDRKVCEAMQNLREKSRFVRGMVSWVGFNQTSLEYVREERFAGESKYPLKKMLRFSMDGITSFSTKPLKLSGYLGMAVTAASSVFLIISLAERWFSSNPSAGYSAVLAGILMLNGMVMIFMGIMGEYLGRVYEESKNRPLYILKNKPPVERVKLHAVKWDVSK